MKHRLLVVHTGGVGDFICTLPTLAVLAETNEIEIAGIPERVGLACEAGLASAAHDIESIGFHSAFSKPNPRLRSFVNAFDDALIWMADNDGTLMRNLRALGIATVRCFPGVPPEGWTRHAAHWYGDCAGHAVSLPFQARFSSTSAAPDIVLQPGSGSPRKNWPLSSFEAVAHSLSQQGHRVAWCAGPAEVTPPPWVESLPPMPLRALACVLAGTRLYIGNDSGISHLAGAAGCPTLAIFGPTDPGVWAPAGPRVRVLQGRPWPEVEAVVAAALDFLHPS